MKITTRKQSATRKPEPMRDLTVDELLAVAGGNIPEKKQKNPG
jgi:hypothetical protein